MANVKNSKKVYLVTGATGLLGNRLVQRLLNEGKTVRVFVENEYQDKRVENVIGDLRDSISVDKAVKGVDVVFHVASYISQDPRNAEKLYDVNVTGTENIINACKKYNVQKLIYTSSIDVVFDGKPIFNGDESLPYPKEYKEPYSYTKAEAEKLVIAANGKDGLVTCALRVASIYGPGDNVRFPTIIKEYNNGGYRRVGNGTSVSSHVFVDNCVHAHVLAEEKLLEGSRVCGQCYFVTDHDAMNVFDFFELVLERLGYEFSTKSKSIPFGVALTAAYFAELWSKMPWRRNSAKPTLTISVVYKISRNFSFVHNKATRDFGYKPLVSLEDALGETENDLRERGFAKS